MESTTDRHHYGRPGGSQLHRSRKDPARAFLPFRRAALALLLLAAAGAPSGRLDAQGNGTSTTRVLVASPGNPPSVQLRLAIALRSLERGDTLRSEDFTVIDTLVTWRWSMPSSDSSTVKPGWIAQRRIEEGEVLRPPGVRAPMVISGGSQVKAVFQDGPVRIVVIGTAVTSAPFGAPVSVRVSRSRRLEGIAIGPNLVQLR